MSISNVSEICCINAGCVNLVPDLNTCNLKGVFINEAGKCSGEVKIKQTRTKKTNDKK